MNDITRAIALAVTDRQSAVDVLRGRLAHDWTDVIPPELRDMYERDWAEAFVERLLEVEMSQHFKDGLEFPCASGCEDGRINNMAAVRAWEDEHRSALDAYDAERRRTRSAWVKPEESALRETEPPWSLACPCRGTGFVLTEEGTALMAFVRRHLAGGGDDGW